jgi:hypothetical protein
MCISELNGFQPHLSLIAREKAATKLVSLQGILGKPHSGVRPICAGA